MPILPKQSQPIISQEDQKKKQGTGFTNIAKTLNASSGQRLGQQVGQGVQGQLNQAKTNLNTAKTGFQQQAEANRLGTQEQRTQAQNTVANAENATDQDADKFAKYRRGTFEGPSGLKDESNLINQSQQAQNLTNLGASGSGRQALLSRFVGGQGYTPGKQRLDSLFLNKNNIDLSGTRNEANKLLLDTGRSAIAARGTAEQYGNEAAQFGQDVRNMLSGETSNIDEDINARLNAVKSLRDSRVSQLGDTFQGKGGFSQEELDRAGLQGVGRTFNTDLNQYVNSNQDINYGNVAEAIDYNKAAGLKKLYGDENLTKADFFNKLSDQTKAGEALKAGLFNIDKDKLNADLEAQKAQYLQKLAATNTGDQYEGLTGKINEFNQQVFNTDAGGNGTVGRSLEDASRFNTYMQQNPQKFDAIRNAIGAASGRAYDPASMTVDTNKVKQAQETLKKDPYNPEAMKTLQNYTAAQLQLKQLGAQTTNFAAGGYNQLAGFEDRLNAARNQAGYSNTLDNKLKESKAQEALNAALGTDTSSKAADRKAKLAAYLQQYLGGNS